jgi:hypothetical protein
MVGGAGRVEVLWRVVVSSTGPCGQPGGLALSYVGFHAWDIHSQPSVRRAGSGWLEQLGALERSLKYAWESCVGGHIWK